VVKFEIKFSSRLHYPYVGMGQRQQTSTWVQWQGAVMSPVFLI